MEAAPKLPMLCFDLRLSPEPVDFGPKLKQFIRNHYNEDPELFSGDINQLECLRSSAVHPTKDINGCSTLKRYYCQLHFLSSRFPMHKGGAAAVKFTWKHLSGNRTNSAEDISLEMTSILYNIGALHTQLGAADDRSNADGMKMSCTHFQCAAWAFQSICKEYAQSAGLDLSLDLLSFMAKLCLGQAQECILEKSMMDNRKASIIAKVSVQTVDYYRQALKIIPQISEDSSLSELVDSKCLKKWEKYLKFKISYHSSISLLFQGQQSEEQQKMGERVALYQASFDKLDEARKLSKGLDNADAVNEALTFVHDVVEGKRKAAKNENEFIYHEDVPDISILPEVKGASLVKGIPFNVNDVEVSGPDIFGRIVPMKAHESSSLYSEEKAKLLRRVVGMIENKDEELETFLSTLQLDDLSKAEGDQFPQELIDRCAALSAKPDAIKNLLDAMNNLSDIYHDVEAMLQEIKEMLNEEEIHEKEYQETIGRRPPTIAATDLTREAKKYQEAHSKASESNQTLHKAMVLHIANMKLLSLPPKELVNQIPPVVESPEVEAVTNEMRHLIHKVNEMKQQRVMLSERLRESIYKDDILRQVVTYDGESLQTLFETELQKHQATVSLIEQNLAAQDNILKAVKDAYARYGATRKGTCEMHRRRDSMIASLIASYDAYEDLLAKSSKGLDFYKKLEVNVSKLLQRVRGTCKVQDEEREQMMKSLKISHGQETQAGNALKLKDYLDMKKEFGKLSIDNVPVPPSNPYFKTPGITEQVTSSTWIPGVRPAPVGSEETEANRMDSFGGLYQAQSRDQTWGMAPYASSQTADDRMKYYVPQAPVTSDVSRMYQPETSAQSVQQDIYPISAYSSVMTNTSSTGYTGPKSNYYNTQNSPSRYINPPHFYPDCSQPPVTGYGSLPASTTPLSSTKNVMESVAPSQAVTYDSAVHPVYPSSQPANSGYATASYSVTRSDASGSRLDATHSSTYGYTPAAADDKGPSAEAAYPQTHYNVYKTELFHPYGYPQTSVSTVSQHDYSGYGHYGLPDSNAASKSLSNYAVGVSYGTGNVAGTQSTPNYTVQDMNYFDSSQGYNVQQQVPVPATPTSGNQTTQTYHGANIPPDPTVPTYSTTDPNSVALAQSYSASNVSPHDVLYSTSSNEYMAQGYGSVTSQPQGYGGAPTWQQARDPSAAPTAIDPPVQHIRSGNESVYTACQTDNYSLTNSDMYKTVDNQTTGTAYQQYYVNQYGACNGQNEYGLNYGNSATYMQAGTDKQQATTMTTYSTSDAKTSPGTEHSNVDLLAGLDFNVDQSPLLLPETCVTSGTSPDSSVSDETGKTSGKERPKSEPAPDESTILNDSLSKTQNPSGVAVPVATPGIAKREDQKTSNDLFTDVEKFNHFAQEVDKYEKFVDSLTTKTLNGPTCLDLKWKEITDLQDKTSHLHIISVARCYPMKNRFADILPYDDSRIELPSTKDDYINASLVKNLTSYTPVFIVTQAPLPSTYGDFWAMVFEQQVEVIVCLLSDSELGGHIYWPTEKGQELVIGKLRVSLQSSNSRPHWIERIASICVAETRVTRVVVHLQFTSWPGSSFPETPGPFVSFANECINFFDQQRSSSHPVAVHCTSGVGRTGLFCLVVSAILDIRNGKGIPDLVTVTGRMSQYRKSSLRDREHLKFAYHAVLYHCRDLLAKQCAANKDERSNEASASRQSTFSRTSSMAERRTSPGRSSPTNVPSDVLTSLDPSTFNLALDAGGVQEKGLKSAKKRYSSESFTKKSELNLDGFNRESDDPLSRLDPLWTMK